jgi:hypothetical protein
MKNVFAHIEKRSAQYRDEPLFVYLRDANIDGSERLRFVPWTTHLIMTFSDLMHFVLPVESPSNHYDELVNVTLSEESTHWSWFLADIARLGLDVSMRFTEAVRILWSEETRNTRKVSYEICRMSATLEPIQKLVMVTAIEATAGVALEALACAASDVEARLGRRLVYFGNHHLDAERDHTIQENAIRLSLEDVVLDPEARSQMVQIVDRVFDGFSGFAQASFHIVEKGRSLISEHVRSDSTALRPRPAPTTAPPIIR